METSHNHSYPHKRKAPTNPTSYKPIALTSCICKTLERMINLRLTWFLESNNLLSNLQTGFRAKRSTIDQLVRIETLIEKEHLVAVLFDLEKAYDTTWWPYGTLKDLKDLGLQGRLLIFIKHFLEDRTFQTWINNTLWSKTTRNRCTSGWRPICDPIHD